MEKSIVFSSCLVKKNTHMQEKLHRNLIELVSRECSPHSKLSFRPPCDAVDGLRQGQFQKWSWIRKERHWKAEGKDLSCLPWPVSSWYSGLILHWVLSYRLLVPCLLSTLVLETFWDCTRCTCRKFCLTFINKI